MVDKKEEIAHKAFSASPLYLEHRCPNLVKRICDTSMMGTTPGYTDFESFDMLWPKLREFCSEPSAHYREGT